MSKPACSIEIVDDVRIQPHTPASAPKTTPLSLLDDAVARFTPCGAIWYFPHSSREENALDPVALRKSLAITLDAYPHFAGDLHLTPYIPNLTARTNAQRYGRLQITYGGVADPGVAFVEAKVDGDMEAALPAGAEREGQDGLWRCDKMLREDVLLSGAGTLAGYASVAGHGKASVAVQVTRFGCGGVAVGVTMAHCLCDALALARFVRDWSDVHAAVVGGLALPELKPVWEPWEVDARAAKHVDDVVADSEVLERAYGLPLHRYDWWLSGEGSGFGAGAHAVPVALDGEPGTREMAKRGQVMPWNSYNVPAPVSHTVVHYTCEQVERIWSAASAGADVGGDGRARLSRHDALVGHVWALVNRARGPENGNVDSEVHCDVSIGLRARVDPPLPPSSMGSPLQLAHTTLPWSIASSAKALPRIASSIKATLSLFTPAAVGAQIYTIAHELAPQRLWQAFLGRQHLIVTSWAHTGLYECDFGTGLIPSYVHPIMPLVDGCMQVMEARPAAIESTGKKWYGAGVDVALYLEKEAMGRLVKDEHIWL